MYLINCITFNLLSDDISTIFHAHKIIIPDVNLGQLCKALLILPIMSTRAVFVNF